MVVDFSPSPRHIEETILVSRLLGILSEPLGYEPDKRHYSTISQILVQRTIVRTDGEIIAHELNSPFVYLRSLVEGLSTPRNGKSGSEHVPLGAQESDKANQNSENLEEFLTGLRFKQHGNAESRNSSLALSLAFRLCFLWRQHLHEACHLQVTSFSPMTPIRTQPGKQKKALRERLFC